MELLNKLFTHRWKNEHNKLQKNSTHKLPIPGDQPGCLAPPFNLQRNGIRVLLFRECDTRGRKLLYDSKTVVRIPIPDCSPAVPSCKTLFKSTFSTGSTQSAGSTSTGSATHLTPNKGSACNVKSSATSPSSKSESFAEISNGYGYQYQKQESDTKLLGELVFGTVALAYRGSCSKLHLMQSPQRILLSRTSPAPRSNLKHSCTSSDQGIEDSSFSSSISSVSETAISRTESLDMPWGIAGGGPAWATDTSHILSTSNSEGDSGFGGPPSPYSSVCGSFLSPTSIPNTPQGTPSSRQGSGNSLKHSGSLNNLQRRFLRNVNTSLEALGRDGESGDDVGTTSQHPHRLTRLGLAVMIEVGGHADRQRQVEEWIFAHLGVIEASVNRLQSSLDLAYMHRRTFVSATHQAVMQLEQDLLDLVSAPRLPRPVWLGLLGKPSHSDRQLLCTSFVNTLSSALMTFDTKQTNFFLSKLLTAVLTHHLGWVSTVAPGDHPVNTLSQVPQVSAEHASLVERLSESHPYNAVWAQLCELSGAVGYPPRAARTLLVGSNASLLSQLLTILSYIIRCSQVVEQDIQPFQEGETQQPTFSRTSSVASVVTIVDGRRDSQRDLSQGRQSSSATLQRDPSIRRSWRMTRDGRSNKLHSTELRGGSGELPADWGSGHVGYSGGDEPKPITSNDSDSSIQHHNRRDADQTSKWMLNDDVEIVIGETKGDLSNKASGSTVKEHKHSKETRTWKPETDILKTSNDSVRTLSTCKTSTNLAALGTSSGNDYSPSKTSTSSLTSFLSRSAREPSTDRLYPSLQELDDHRETFGPESIQPDVIAEKVKKLFHASSTVNTELYKDRPVTHTISCCSLPQECSRRDIPTDELQSEVNITTLPRMKRSPIRSVSYSAQKEKAVDCSENRTNSLSNYVNKVENAERTSRAEITVPARDIQPEVEEGGKVLFLLGENERLEGLKSKCKIGENNSLEPESTWASMKESTNAAAIGFEGFTQGAKSSTDNIAVTKSEVQVIGRLPSPVDSRKLVKIRHVGRASARDLPSLEREQVFCPQYSSLNKDLQVCVNSVSGKCTTTKSEKARTAKHHRRHSDPTNGTFISKTPLYPNIELLKDVVEEQVTESKDPSSFKKDTERKDDSSVRQTPVCVSSSTEEFDEWTSKQLASTDKTPEAVQDANQENNENSCEQPVVIQIPRCACATRRSSASVNTTGSQIAESLLGGVLDHYSSVFVLHATTQSSQWEDALRQDLSSAAHNSTLDPQVSEAVAVVADTDNWEVQVVSSHSYVVERSGIGSQVGLRVGMSPLVSAITDSILDLAKMGIEPQFIMQHLEERLCELYLKSQLLAEYLLGGAACSLKGSEATFSPFNLPELTKALGLDLNDLPLLLAVASTHTPALTKMFGLSIK
ncbi:uncharacterized protein LOC119578829 isoform X2 [Penaeus monodon]|uniref:uncharacterized protein LOC119578829 isoform X2 n=1 Tax=Penaeus monodon TaxID=6687 RepID=UPI0018A78E29|nr:uncharacterized protein LOC119578829 isoform X2 [Penaeus monodon]